MTNFEIINSLFDSYKFTEAMPDDVRRAIIQSKKEVLIKILKKTGKYSIFTLLIINVVIVLKKFGIGTTVAKVYFISAVAAVAVTVSAVAVIAVIGYHSLKTQPVSETKAPVSAPADIHVIKTENKKTVTPAIKYVIEITPFKSREDIAAESSRVAEDIRRTLASISGENAAVLSKDDSTFNTKFVVNGLVAKVGEKYYIGVKLVNTSNSEIIAQINRTAEGKENIDSAANEIARDLVVYLK